MVDWALQSTTSKTSTTQQTCICWTYQGAGEFHAAVHLKEGGLECIEEAELGEQWRWCLQSWSPSHGGWAHGLREPSSSRRGSTHDSSLLATVALANHRWLGSSGSGAHNLISPAAEAPITLPPQIQPAMAAPPNLTPPGTTGCPWSPLSSPPPVLAEPATQGILGVAEAPTTIPVPQQHQQQQGTSHPRGTSSNSKGTCQRPWRVESASSQM